MANAFVVMDGRDVVRVALSKESAFDSGVTHSQNVSEYPLVEESDDMARARARRQREDDVKLANAEFEIGAGIARHCVAVWLVRQLIEANAVPDIETANAIGALVLGCPLPKRDPNRMLGVAP